MIACDCIVRGTTGIAFIVLTIVVPEEPKSYAEPYSSEPQATVEVEQNDTHASE